MGDESDDVEQLTDHSGNYSSEEETEDAKSTGDHSPSKMSRQSEGNSKKDYKPNSPSSSYQTLPASEEKSFSVTPLFWIILFGCVSVPAAIVLSHLCETGDSFTCESYRKVFNSIAPGFQYFRKPSSVDDHDSGDGSSSDLKDDGKGKRISDLSWVKRPIPNSRLLTDEEIKYVENGPLYLVIVGHVFDVTAGKSMYAPGTGYFGFIGKDGSRAFISGEFNEKGLVDDLDNLDGSDYLGLAGWIKFYFEKYAFVGYHIGRFFDEAGKQTAYMKKFRGYLRQAEVQEDKEKDLRNEFPPCNVAWSSEQGSRVWCTDESGGIKRDWVGVPREFYETKKSPRCACIHPNLLSDPRVRQYPNCDPKSVSCVPPEEKKD